MIMLSSASLDSQMIFTKMDTLANAKSEENHNCTKCDIQLKMTSHIQKILTNPIRIRIIFKITGFAFNREVLLVRLGLMAEPAKTEPDVCPALPTLVVKYLKKQNIYRITTLVIINAYTL